MLEKFATKKRTSGADFKYTILIPTWNNMEFLKLCIRSIQKNSQFSHQIIVIVNEGKDGSLEWVDSQQDIDYTYSHKNIGICYGLNSARSLIKTNYIVYANDDMYFLPDWDLEFHNEIEKIGHQNFMLSGTMIEPDNTGNPCVIVANYGRSVSDFKEEKLLCEFNTYIKADWNGSTWPPNIVPLALWDLVGGMSIEFSPGFYSDPDLSMKLWQIGVRHFKGLGKSRVYHFGSKSTNRIRINNGKKIFLKKWGISSNFFTTKYLKRGGDFSLLSNPQITKWESFVNKLKRIKSVL